MKFLLLAAFVGLAAAGFVPDGVDRDDRDRDTIGVILSKDRPLVNLDIKTKELCILKLLNHILQPTMYQDVRDIAREFVIEENTDKFTRTDVVKKFLKTYRMGLLPKGEVFVHTNDKHIEQAIKVFKLLMCCKDFDVFIRTCCWLRERINGGMFVYAVTAACFHREDCRGVVLPAPYEIYPYLFVDADIIHKAKMVKTARGVADPVVMKYHGIVITDKNCIVVDWRKGVRNTLTLNDRLNYFTEDIDLNTYMYYLHLNYPHWVSDRDDTTSLNKERRGEIKMYAYQQLLARLRLERLGRRMCDIKPLKLEGRLKEGYWPKLQLHTGLEMPVRSNDVKVVTEKNIELKRLIEDLERLIRDGILHGRIILRDGTEISLKKSEDVELLCRLILGGIGIVKDDAKTMHLVHLFKKLLTYNRYNINKNTYIPTALDMYTTCLRDPVFWKVMKRIINNVILFKKMLPKYTREELDFPGVKVESIVTDKLTTFMDEYDVDITNAMYLDQSEFQKMRTDHVTVARMRRLNHHPFKITIDVSSDKAVDAVVRVFLGPKYDCMGRLLDVNDKRHDMVEIDSFLHRLDTGKTTIVRDSHEMRGVIGDRPMTRQVWDRVYATTGFNVDRVVENFWHRARIGFPRRLLLPLGTKGGLDLQLFVIVTPVRNGLTIPSVDINVMKERRACRWTSCIDTMPLGFPFDREIDETCFFTNNMKLRDVKVFRKDMDTKDNMSKDIDLSELVLRRDDLTYLDSDMLERRSYRDVMLSVVNDRMTRM